MTSAVFSEPKARSERAPPLSLSIDSPLSASPFPSPSSSFLPPPMPGAHEFAVKPAPPGRMGKKAAQKTDGETSPPDTSSSSSNPSSPQKSRDPSPPPALSPTTPTPNKLFHQASPSSPLSKSSPSPTMSPTTTPTVSTTTLPNSHKLPKTPTSPSSPSFYTSLHSSSSSTNTRDSSSLTPNRPAPPSPAMSRRASAAPSISSVRSKSSRSPSTTISRANSTRKVTSSRQSTQLTPSSQPSASTFATPPTIASMTPRRRSFVKIRDFAFSHTDDRHNGLGPDVPRPNRIKTLNRHLRSGSISSASSTTSSDDEDDEDDDDGDGWGGFKWGMGRFSWQFGAAAGASSVGDKAGGSGDGGFPSKTDFTRNFVDDGDYQDEGGDEDDFDDEDEEDEELEEDTGDEEPLYPGLYRALYSFEPEGTAEMALEEDQIVRVIGRGGGVGWAVVVDDEKAQGGVGEVHALVPESYLEVVRLDEDEEEEVE